MKRATNNHICKVIILLISIHALVKRATDVYDFYLEQFRISIHALVKRATLFSYFHYTVSPNFNPRPREEGDKGFYATLTVKLDFNPRPREEGDTVGVWQELVFFISIHALVKRAT